MSDHDLEQIARTLARTDSREMILATSDESELHHVSDSGWRDWLPHAKALVADGHISSPAETAPKDAIYDVVLKELETKHIMPTSVMLATRITNAIVALRSPAAIDDEDSYERGFRAGYECAGCQPQPVTERRYEDRITILDSDFESLMADRRELERLRNLDIMHEAAQKLLAAERDALLDQVEELKSCLHDFVFKEAVCDQTIERAERLVSDGGGK